ncbi:MAG: DUF924 family protein [Alphaproteobacteria bacterium]|nr:DUF924 family protein [Alphaproteobacteria bacterium]
MSDLEIEAVLKFWFEECEPKNWFMKDADFDNEIRKRFLGLHTDVADNARDHWRDSPKGCLAEVIVLDQFSRNMFRDTPGAFAYDDRALECMNHTIKKDYHRSFSVVEKNFLYLPMQHSEDLEVQRQSVELYLENGDNNTLDYAIRHKRIIEKFGRFPHRNEILGRASTEEEIEFLKKPGSSF